MQLSGNIERIVYQAEETGFAILEVVLTHTEVDRLRKEAPEYADDIYDEMMVLGTLSLIHPASYVTFTGNFARHATYGVRFQASSYEESEPADMDAIEHYLGSGAIKGMGAALAGRIVKKFKMDTFRIIEEEPERLAEVKGISERMAMDFADQINEKRQMREAMIYLEKLGIGMNLAVKIYKQYGERLYQILKENPYRLADDIQGVGFKIADDIAKNIGVSEDSPSRIKSGILYTLNQSIANGHIYVPMEPLLEQAENILGVPISDSQELLTEMMIEGKIVVKEAKEGKAVYAKNLYATEISVARHLMDLDVNYPVNPESLEAEMKAIEKANRLQLDELQRQAVRMAAQKGLLIITGGPGTGKTTTINTMISYFERAGMDILLAAPTGRAAKRMSEATDWEAQTIHRLLEISGLAQEDNLKSDLFNRNEENPLEADVIIIDEMSMVDVYLMNSLLKAIAIGTRLILVGDADQLPSVGPGAVLSDMIASEQFTVVKLTRIFRQEEAGDIVNNAHKINQGEPVELKTSSKDFPFIKRTDAQAVLGAMVTLIRDKLPQYVHCKPEEVQVLTPTRKGSLGVERLNMVLQQYLNPPQNYKVEKEINGILFREGDKVMQVKNNYNLTWEIKGLHGVTIETGTGIFNGDMGTVETILTLHNEMVVRFEDNRYVTYSFSEVEELEHAYAITVHKSQGSEYPAVVMPMLDVPKLLMNRNILYTAVTRAKQCICMVGDDATFYRMANNHSERTRYTSLAQRIQEVALSES